MAEFTSRRRYCLYKRLSANTIGDTAIGALWQYKQEAEPGTTLPDGFPNKTELAAFGYVADSDLDGADTCELEEYVGLTTQQAASVLAAAAAL